VALTSRFSTGLPKKEIVDRIGKAHFKMKKKETQLDQENAETKHACKKI
jgi:hypothetical protein